MTTYIVEVRKEGRKIRYQIHEQKTNRAGVLRKTENWRTRASIQNEYGIPGWNRLKADAIRRGIVQSRVGGGNQTEEIQIMAEDPVGVRPTP